MLGARYHVALSFGQNGTQVAPLRAASHGIQYIGHYLVYPKRRTRHEAAKVFKKCLRNESGMRPTSVTAPG